MPSAIAFKEYFTLLLSEGRIPDVDLRSCVICFGKCVADLDGFQSAPFLTARIHYKNGLGIVEFMPMGSVNANVYWQLLHSMGVKQLISVGFAGGHSGDLSVGDQVLVSKSYHQGGSFSGFGVPEKVLCKADMIDGDLPLVSNFSTDNPFSEGDKAAFFKRFGIQTVDMEVSLLAGLSVSAGVDYAAILVISDNLHGDQWQPGFSEASRSIKSAQELAISSL